MHELSISVSGIYQFYERDEPSLVITVGELKLSPITENGVHSVGTYNAGEDYLVSIAESPIGQMCSFTEETQMEMTVNLMDDLVLEITCEKKK